MLERNEAYVQLERANRFIRKTFGRYLSDDIVNTILESPEGLELGGEKRVVTLMMTDLRGFTAIGERLPAEIVVNMINIYLEVMTEIIFKYQGTIDEFIGDAILAIFGAPIQRDNDAPRAVACAVEMQLAMEEVNQRNRDEGYPDVAMGIGINTGELVVGNIGSKKRTKYGVVGSIVNLTSRIESYTVGGQTYISESTYQACGDILRVDGHMDVMPKGVQHPIRIYEVGGISGEFNIFLPEKDNLELFDLPQALVVTFTVLEGKHAGTEQYAGEIIRLNGNVAELRADAGCHKLDNLKMTLSDSEGNILSQDLYGKVVEVLSDAPLIFRLNFTSMPPQVETFFDNIQQAFQQE